MANEKITEMDAATTPLDYTEIIEVVQAGDNRQVPLSAILENINTIQLDTSPTPGAHSEGKMYWDADAGTLAIMTDVTNVVLQVGQEMYIKARNQTGSQINNGQVVYISGSTGSRPRVSLAKADALATSDVLGLATENIANNSDGYIAVFGLVHDLNTSAFEVGDVLYLSATVAGAMQNTPAAISVKIGLVIYKHASQGIILVRI